jgi:hypothetical protein
MDRSRNRRPLLVDPAAPRRTPRERVALRWFADTGRAAPRDRPAWGAVDAPEPGRLAAAA